MDNLQQPLVSIIIPVYNVEKYLHRCVDSILAQTCSDFELILVDDGSKDSSGSICDQYATQDSRIKVIHIPNGGVSNARNTGLDAATGEYVIFVDSDDWVSPAYIQNLLPSDGEDLVHAGCQCVQNDEVTSVVATEDHVVNPHQWREDFSSHWVHGALLPPWGNCYRRSVIEYAQIRFDKSISLSEDELFNLNFLQHCGTVRYTKTADYFYNISPSDSLTQRHHPDRTLSCIKTAQAVEQLIGVAEYHIRWSKWHIALEHHRKHVKRTIGANKKMIKQHLKDCYAESYFQECVPYIRKTGSLDEKVESFFMHYSLHVFYKPCYKTIQFFHKLKRFLIRR